MPGGRKPGVLSAADSRDTVIDLVRSGLTVADAWRRCGRSPKMHDYWRRTDERYRTEIEVILALRKRGVGGRLQGKQVPPFAEFSEKYLGARVFWHQLQWVDLLEGNPPRDLHRNEVYEEGRRGLILVNTPPEHAKSTTLNVNYAVWRICSDPNIRIIVVSKTKEMANKFVYQIKNRLTHPRFRDLQLAFGPAEGWKASSDIWKSDMIYLGQDERDSGEKDPTVMALGIGGQIYGARADLIILDDCVTLANAHEYEKQLDWISQEVLTRLSDRGRMLIIGTRVAEQDLYSEIRDVSRYTDGACPYTYLAQPAVLEFAEDPKDWVTLWPRTNVPQAAKDEEPDEDGLYPMWDGPRLARRRSALTSSRTWPMVYMQQQVSDHAVFPAEAVRAAINGQRATGILHKGLLGHRPEGMEGLYVVGGLDPAMTGHTAAVVMGVDRLSRKRYVLDVFNQSNVTPDGIRELIKNWTVKFSMHEWRIEKNAFQLMLTQDREVRDFLASRGVVLREHHTGRNKWDVDFGVASMSMLFDGWEDGRQLIELPSTKQTEGIKALVEQLIVWSPESRGKTDCVMALWFAEIRAREITQPMGGRTHLANNYLTPRGRERQMTVNLDDYWSAKNAGVAV